MNNRTPTLGYATVCSGIEAVTVAWRPLGLTPAWFVEIDPFANAVLAHHYPDVPNWGNMNEIGPRLLRGGICAPDILIGGTPCQAFSVAGLRQGFRDPRGALTMSFVELANAIDQVRARQNTPPAIVVWENVPGVLSDRANAFGCFVGALAGEDRALEPPGEKWTHAGCVYGPQRALAWRVLDAQHFGLAQRRKRVFVVASACEGFDPCTVLFESESLQRNSPAGAQARQDTTAPAASSPARAGGTTLQRESEHRQRLLSVCFGGNRTSGPIEHAACLTTRGYRNDFEHDTFAVQALTGDVTHALNSANNGKGCSEDGTGRGVPIVATRDCLTQSLWLTEPTLFSIAFAQNSRGELRWEGGDGCVVGALSRGGGKPGQGQPVVASVSLRGRQRGAAAELGGELCTAPRASSGGADKPHVFLPSLEAHFECTPHASTGGENNFSTLWRVRRLLPMECERLQGLPDNYTLVSYRGRPAPDGPRYKAIGNSMAVPCIAWIGGRLLSVLIQHTGDTTSG